MSKKILLCDDEVTILRAAQFKLVRAGYDVRTASDGQEGFEAIQEEMPDLLISDYQMPRLDGLGLIRRLRESEATANLPVILLTAKGLELSHEELTRELGIIRVVSKPFSPAELRELVDHALESEVMSSV